MTDTDIAALTERLRHPPHDAGTESMRRMLEAANALEALHAENEYWKERTNFIEVLRQELATMQARAETAEAALKQIMMLDPDIHSGGQAQIFARHALAGGKP